MNKKIIVSLFVFFNLVYIMPLIIFFGGFFDWRTGAALFKLWIIFSYFAHYIFFALGISIVIFGIIRYILNKNISDKEKRSGGKNQVIFGLIIIANLIIVRCLALTIPAIIQFLTRVS